MSSHGLSQCHFSSSAPGLFRLCKSRCFAHITVFSEILNPVLQHLLGKVRELRAEHSVHIVVLVISALVNAKLPLVNSLTSVPERQRNAKALRVLGCDRILPDRRTESIPDWEHLSHGRETWLQLNRYRNLAESKCNFLKWHSLSMRSRGCPHNKLEIIYIAFPILMTSAKYGCNNQLVVTNNFAGIVPKKKSLGGASLRMVKSFSHLPLGTLGVPNNRSANSFDQSRVRIAKHNWDGNRSTKRQDAHNDCTSRLNIWAAPSPHI